MMNHKGLRIRHNPNTNPNPEKKPAQIQARNETTTTIDHKHKAQTQKGPSAPLVLLAKVAAVVVSVLVIASANKLRADLHQPVVSSLKQLCTNKYKCLLTAGKNGTWVQDWEFARKYGQYSYPWAVPAGPYCRHKFEAFRPSNDAPFTWPTSWKWVDHDPDCQVNIVTHNALCEVLGKHKIHRILFYGDVSAAEVDFDFILFFVKTP
jgi:hypothetical protein